MVRMHNRMIYVSWKYVFTLQRIQPPLAPRLPKYVSCIRFHKTQIPFEVCNPLVVPSQQLLQGSMEVLLCERVNEELFWCPSWSNSLWQGWSCGLVHCPCGNATDPIWRVLATSNGMSSWTPLKPQHSNPNPNPLVYWFFTPPTPLIIPHRVVTFLESLMPLKT